jgi:hypothetical protein
MFDIEMNRNIFPVKCELPFLLDLVGNTQLSNPGSATVQYELEKYKNKYTLIKIRDGKGNK